MSQPNRFAGGFLLGAVFGGILGGILGITLSQRQAADSDQNLSGDSDDGTEGPMDNTRRGLEDKIAQLSEAIDDVQQQLRNVQPLADLNADD
ncbi:hypothetical protein [Synechococcus elongatus]|uniref:hypothetical protein n=1 Tax=Synechococcus elongatus TaxID=32046 RepID=UPI0030D5E0B0